MYVCLHGQSFPCTHHLFFPKYCISVVLSDQLKQYKDNRCPLQIIFKMKVTLGNMFFVKDIHLHLFFKPFYTHFVCVTEFLNDNNDFTITLNFKVKFNNKCCLTFFASRINSTFIPVLFSSRMCHLAIFLMIGLNYIY